MRMNRILSACGLGLFLAAGACSTETKFTEVEPPQGTFSGGEEVVLHGANFPKGGVSVKFGLREARNVVVVSDNEIKVTTPAGDRGTAADVTLGFDDGRTFVLHKAFRYMDGAQQRDTMDKFFQKASGEKKSQ